MSCRLVSRLLGDGRFLLPIASTTTARLGLDYELRLFLETLTSGDVLVVTAVILVYTRHHWTCTQLHSRDTHTLSHTHTPAVSACRVLPLLIKLLQAKLISTLDYSVVCDLDQTFRLQKYSIVSWP